MPFRCVAQIGFFPVLPILPTSLIRGCLQSKIWAKGVENHRFASTNRRDFSLSSYEIRNQEPTRFMPTAYSNSTRLGLSIVAVLLMILLACARWLEPSITGFGTHRQIGLPPCTTYALFGVKCPSCGMTTAWAFTTRLRFHEALNANMAGTLLCIQAVLSIPYLLVMVFTKRDPLGRFFSAATVWGITCNLVLAVTLWVVSLIFRN